MLICIPIGFKRYVKFIPAEGRISVSSAGLSKSTVGDTNVTLKPSRVVAKGSDLGDSVVVWTLVSVGNMHGAELLTLCKAPRTLRLVVPVW